METVVEELQVCFSRVERGREGRKKEGRLHFKKTILLLFKKIFIYVATLGLSCGTWSLVVSA